jgi:hypothetical protein
MNEELLRLLIIACALFCPAAALASFLITLNEYTHHFKDKSLALKIALKNAVITFFVFAIIVCFIGFMILKIIK